MDMEADILAADGSLTGLRTSYKQPVLHNKPMQILIIFLIKICKIV